VNGRRLLAATGLLVAGLGVPTAAQADEADLQECTVGVTKLVKDPGLSNALTMISAPQSWRLATGKGVTVAVVDSGIDADNVHLSGRTRPGFSLLGDDGRDDDHGHGTLVAGIAAAKEVKGSAVIGAAPDATLLPVRVYDYPATDGITAPRQPLSAGGIAQGIRWAADHGADVITVAISSAPDVEGIGEQRDAVRYALAKDAVVVAAAGNSPEGAPITMPRYPAAFPGVIGVAAVNPSGSVDDYSIHGPHVDVAAPGQNILTTFYGNGDCLVGTDHPYTSYATGFVAGVAAQLREKFPDESNDMIAWRMLSTAQRDELGARSDEAGWGLVKPYDALSVIPDPTRPGPPLPGAPKVQRAAEESGLAARPDRPDPMVAVRREAAWWSLAAVGLAGLALLLRPLLLRRRHTS